MVVAQKIAELQDRGFCVLKGHFPTPLIEACRRAFWPALEEYLKAHKEAPNRGPRRYFLPMSFEPPCYAPEFFFDAGVLSIVHGAMDDRVVADQWGCDVPLKGSEYQQFHIDYRRPLIAESPDLLLPMYILNVSFGLIQITNENGPTEIAEGTHRMSRKEALQAIKCGQVEKRTIPLEIGDVLIRHPWAWHRGTPNTTEVPRPLLTVRYVRYWYADDSREVNPIPQGVWRSLKPEQQSAMRFPLETTIETAS